MQEENKVLIVVNPAADRQPAVERMATGAHDGQESSEVYLLLAADPSMTDTRANNEAVYRNDAWLAELQKLFEGSGIKVHTRISWSREWADSILYSAQHVGASYIMLSHPGVGNSGAFSDEFWYMLRHSPLPLTIVQSARPPQKRPVMVALDLQDKGLVDLNQRVFSAAKKAAEARGSELHLVNAYQDSMNYPDRGRLVNLTGLPNDQVHLRAGEVFKALVDVGQELDPDLVVVGTTRRTGFRAAMRGRKLGNILSSLEYDLLLVV
ncbi:MAG: universal stress protein [Porticoccaceae bacterium]|nr:universal stress protein [Porticoccaceae bacterium]